MVIDYYFSVLSDWAYMGGERLELLARRYQIKINHMPMRLGMIYANTGCILLQKRSKQRQDYRVTELVRWSQHLGIPIDLFTPIFAVSRIAGWAAHVIEQHDDNRLIRPRADYVGPPYPEPYIPIAER